jgi:hypothetical protein
LGGEEQHRDSQSKRQAGDNFHKLFLLVQLR